MGPSFIETLEIGRFHGVGPVTRAKMNRLSIATGLDLRRQSREFLERHFGKSGAYFYSIARESAPLAAEALQLRLAI
jgi:DNA polymerase IV